MSISGQVEALVSLRARLRPAPVIIDQVPERDVIAALRQEQATGAQRVANGKSQGDFPDSSVEFVAGDEMRPPVRLYEVMRVIRRQPDTSTSIQAAQDFDGFEQYFTADSCLERQSQKAG